MGDIDNQNAGNYKYDEIGNLTGNVKDGIGTKKTDGTSNGDGITWTVYGKISSVTKTGTTASQINYTYNVAGNCISKVVNQGGVKTTTWYVRDASGNVMSIYSQGGTGAVNGGDLSQTEIPIYGSSRLGEFKPGTLAVNVQTSLEPTPVTTVDNVQVFLTNFTRGQKIFELSNHLGNVLVTVSDKLVQVADANGDGNIASYTADVASANDYYPFGMLEPGRQFTAASASGYRYGFNGQENSDEIGANTTTAEFWEYDARIGRRWDIDPQNSDITSDYLTLGNNPINNIDPNGAWFFGLFGSTSAQRSAADALAKEGNGEVVNRNRRSIHATYNVVQQTGENAYSASKQTSYFLKDGRSTTKSYYDWYYEGGGQNTAIGKEMRDWLDYNETQVKNWKKPASPIQEGAYTDGFGNTHTAPKIGEALVPVYPEAIFVPLPKLSYAGRLLDELAFGKQAGRIFWAGGGTQGLAYAEATAFAAKSGGTALEMTTAGRTLTIITNKFGMINGKMKPWMYKTWGWTSRQFAKGAQGEANAFIDVLRANPGGVYFTIEKPALLSNGVNITEHFVK